MIVNSEARRRVEGLALSKRRWFYCTGKNAPPPDKNAQSGLSGGLAVNLAKCKENKFALSILHHKSDHAGSQ